MTLFKETIIMTAPSLSPLLLVLLLSLLLLFVFFLRDRRIVSFGINPDHQMPHPETAASGT